MQQLPMLAIILMVATLIVLILGVVLMGTGSKLNQRYGNKLMVLRVVLQGLALATLFALYLTYRH